MKKILAIGAVVAALSSGRAAADFYTYFEWDRLAPRSQAAYVAGLMDAFYAGGMVSGGYLERVGKHNLACIIRLDIRSSQLAENVQAYARQHPASQSAPLISILLGYLEEACGKPA